MTEANGAKNGKKSIPKAIKVFRVNAFRYPAKAWYKRVEGIVGEAEEDLDFWGLVVLHYVGHGWNPTNVANMLRFYARGQVPGRPDLQRDPRVVDQRSQPTAAVDVAGEDRRVVVEVSI